MPRRGGDGALAIEVVDDGPGIPENRMAAVFDPFVRRAPPRKC